MRQRRLVVGKAILAAIVFAYCLLGLAYAVETPKWQSPDEPAHYNYVEYLAEKRSLPVLVMGDYPHDYLEEIKAAGFPPEMSIEPLRYEFHQPPLYYLLAALVYRITGPMGFDVQFLALRLLSVALGAILLLVAYLVVSEIFPRNLFLSLTSTAMIATLPMHIAMTASINNDTLAELLLALVIWLCVEEVKVGLSRRQIVALGLLIGLALLTKTTIYAPAVACGLMALGIGERQRWWRTLLTRVGLVCGLALLLSGWWFLRNVATYGDLDLFGWHRHDSIVSGQPTTALWVAQYGLAKTLQDFFEVSFRSFWAQFGWMGVLIDSRLYLLLAAFSMAVLVGFALWLVGITRSSPTLTKHQLLALALLLLVFTVVALEDVYYNLKFVQHQGRYLFPALIPISLAFALGLLEWPTLLYRAAVRWRPRWGHVATLRPALTWATFSIFYAGFVVLDVACLYLFVVPQLRG
jgi:4-amino-4-deoxy-L-arabinose transferase-like glycosyltransferase